MTVQEIIQEIVSEVVSDLAYTDARWLNYFKSASRLLPSFAQSRLFISEGTVTLTTGASSVILTSLSPKFISERSVWWVDTDGSPVTIDKAQSTSILKNLYSATASGKPELYQIKSQTIYFDKKADSALTIWLDYFKEISTVVLADTVAMDERVIEALKSFTKAQYFMQYEKDSESADWNSKLAAALVKKMNSEYENQEGQEHIVETEVY